GLFEAATGGTLLLDEIGELPIGLQAKLLRVLQEGEIRRVGDQKTRKVDARVLAATARDLDAEIPAGRVRQDPVYRINAVPVETLADLVAATEREAIIEALTRATGNRREAARSLGVSLRTLFYKIDRYGIS